MRSPYTEFVLTNIICIEKALKGTEIVFVLTGISYQPFVLTMFYCTNKCETFPNIWFLLPVFALYYIYPIYGISNACE